MDILGYFETEGVYRSFRRYSGVMKSVWGPPLLRSGLQPCSLTPVTKCPQHPHTKCILIFLETSTQINYYWDPLYPHPSQLSASMDPLPPPIHPITCPMPFYIHHIPITSAYIILSPTIQTKYPSALEAYSLIQNQQKP